MKLDTNDIKGLLETFEEPCFMFIQNKKDINQIELQQNVKQLLYDVYDLTTKQDNISISQRYYLDLLLPDMITEFIRNIYQKYESHQKVKNTFLNLKLFIK